MNRREEVRGLGSRLEEVKEGRRDRGKPGEHSPGAKERSAHRRREGSAHQILLKVRSVETEPTTGLGSRKIIGDLDKSVPSSGLQGAGKRQWRQ